MCQNVTLIRYWVLYIRFHLPLHLQLGEVVLGFVQVGVTFPHILALLTETTTTNSHTSTLKPIAISRAPDEGRIFISKMPV